MLKVETTRIHPLVRTGDHNLARRIDVSNEDRVLSRLTAGTTAALRPVGELSAIRKLSGVPLRR
jgi:hypothetical protein